MYRRDALHTSRDSGRIKERIVTPDGHRISVLESTKEAALIQEQAVEATEIARRAVALAEDKQASNIVLLDLRRLNSIADYFVICTGGSERQLKAITEAIDEGLAREYDIQPRIEGTADTGWVLLDYGDVVVHIFSVELRDRYRLERLWSKATPVVVLQ